jgi:hypothetical protein
MRTIGTPSVVSGPSGLPRPSKLRAPSGLNAPRNPAHRSRPGVAASCVSTVCGVPLGQRRAADSPCGSSCVTTRDASDRLLPSHVYVRAPAPRRFPGSSCAFAPAPRGDRLPHVSAIRFGGPHVLLFGFATVGLLFPSWCVRTGPLMPLSPLPRVTSRSRGVRTRRSRRDRLQPVRVNEAGRGNDPGHLPSDEDLCPATPSRAPGSGLSRCERLGHRCSGRRHLFTGRRTLSDPPVGRAPVHAPRCQRESRFSEPRCRSSTSATLSCDARAHPTSRRSSHASGAFAPLLAGTNRCRLRRPPRCVAAPGACEPRSARDGLRRRVPLAWTGQIAGRGARVKASRALLDDVARALLVTLRAPGSPVRFTSRFGVPRRSSPRPRSPSDAAPEGRHRRKDQGAFCRTGTLTRAEDGSSVRAWTAAPSRRLRGGIARELARLFDRFRGAFF